MDCLSCRRKSCRSVQSCGAEKFRKNDVLDTYGQVKHSQLVRNAASLVDNGRGGTLSRIQELIEFAVGGEYRKVGLAYCYGMEKTAGDIRRMFLDGGVPCIGISCTCGAMAQSEINSESRLPGVSCNPVSQAAQLTAEGVDLAVQVGLCLGHDILFTREFAGDQTTLVVKDRVHGHNPLAGVEVGRQ